MLGYVGKAVKGKEVSVITPERFSDVEYLIKKFRAREGVIVDFDGIPPHLAQRMLDFLSGAVFALEGSICKLKYKMYILITQGVKINTLRKN